MYQGKQQDFYGNNCVLNLWASYMPCFHKMPDLFIFILLECFISTCLMACRIDVRAYTFLYFVHHTAYCSIIWEGKGDENIQASHSLFETSCHLQNTLVPII